MDYRLFNVSACGLLMCIACGGGKQPGAAGGPPRMKATIVATTIQPATYTVTEEFPATLTANNIVEVRADVTGYLEAIRAKDGSTVAKGQALYEIDKSRYAATYGQQQASLQQVQADLAQKQRDLERYQKLLENDAISRQTVEQAGTAAKTAAANVAAAKAALQKAGTDVDHAVLRAPVGGKIGIAQLRVGDIVNAGQTLINTIVNEDPMFVDFDVPQRRFREFTNTVDKERTFLLRFSDGTQYAAPGKVLTINNIVDPQTGTIRVRLQFPNTQGELKSGMTAVVMVKNASAADALAVPAKAVMETLSEKNVFVVGQGDVIQLRAVEPGATTDTMVIIRSGLKGGEKIVVDGLQKVKPGDTVNVKMLN